MNSMSKTSRGGRWAAPLLFLIGAGVLGANGCGEDAEPPAESDPASEAPRGSTYVVRGVVVDLPRPDRPSSGFVLNHEAIENWMHSDGTIGMQAMQMPFISETKTDFSGVKIGDKVAITWITWWEESEAGARARSIIEDIRVLDPATELKLAGG